MQGQQKRGVVRLKDIAQRVGVSINTVSHALKDKDDISVEMKKQIRETAEEMGYIGNATARSLRSGSTQTIAVILGDISNPHFSIIVKEIETRLTRLGYTLIIFNTDENAVQEKQAINTALQKNVDGVIICPTSKGGNLTLLESNSVPFVLIGRRPKSKASYVVCDDEGSGYIATRHLLELGHRNILFLNGPKTISSSLERFAGYKRALEESGIPLNKQKVIEVPITMGAGKSKLEKALHSVPDCTAVLAFSDMIAWEVIYRLKQRGLNVPTDISVVGFDNIQSRYPFPVELTTISSSKTTMSQVAVELLMEQIESATSLRHVVLKTKLVIRDSSVQL